jgi:hypothetical protein
MVEAIVDLFVEKHEEALAAIAAAVPPGQPIDLSDELVKVACALEFDWAWDAFPRATAPEVARARKICLALAKGVRRRLADRTGHAEVRPGFFDKDTGGGERIVRKHDPFS